jgi:hypothetical protein
MGNTATHKGFLQVYLFERFQFELLPPRNAIILRPPGIDPVGVAA